MIFVRLAIGSDAQRPVGATARRPSPRRTRAPRAAVCGGGCGRRRRPRAARRARARPRSAAPGSRGSAGAAPPAASRPPAAGRRRRRALVVAERQQRRRGNRHGRRQDRDDRDQPRGSATPGAGGRTAGGPEAATLAGRRRGSAERPRLVIRRRLSQRAQHADAEQPGCTTGDDHEDVHAVSHRHRDGQEREQADDRQAAAEDRASGPSVHGNTVRPVVVLVHVRSRTA